MDNEIEVEFSRTYEALRLTCNDATFDRLHDLIRDATASHEVGGTRAERLKWIHIVSASAISEAERSPAKPLQAVSAAAMVLASGLSFFVYVVGIYTIVRWAI